MSLTDEEISKINIKTKELGRGLSAYEIADTLDLLINPTNSNDLITLVKKVIEENQDVVSDFKGGNKNAKNKLIGKVMKSGKFQASEVLENLDRELNLL